MNKYTGFTTIDPLHPYASPFMGMGNNPVALTDPLGAAVSGGNEWVEAAMQDYIYNQIDASTNTFDADYNFLRYGSTGYHGGGGGVPSYQTPNMDRYEAQQQTGADIAMNQIETGISYLIMLNIIGMDEPEVTYFTFTDKGVPLDIPEGYQYSYTIQVEVKGSAGLQLGLEYIILKDIGGTLGGPGIEGIRTFSLVYLQTDNKFLLKTEGETYNIDYNIGISIFDLIGISKIRKFGIYKANALNKQTIVKQKMYMTEVSKVNGVYDDASWNMKFGIGVDVRIGVGVSASVEIIIGYSPLLNP